MDSFFNMVDVQTVLFIYMAVGFFCRKVRIFTDEARDKLTDFVVLVTLPCLLVGVICAAVAVGVDVGSTVLLLVLGLLFSGVMAQSGLLANLRFPKLDAPNDTVVVKQSASVLIIMFGSWVLLAALGFGYFFLFSRRGETAGLLIAAGVCALLNVVLWRLLATVGIKLFRDL